MNFIFNVSRYEGSKEKTWGIHHGINCDISSLRRLNDFEILLMRLSQAGVGLEIDTRYECEDVTPETKPEPTYE